MELGTVPPVRWRKWLEQDARADVVIDVRERLAPFVKLPPEHELLDLEPPVAIVPEPERVHPPEPYRPRHLAT